MRRIRTSKMGIFSSVDYSAIEVSTLAQVCLNMGLDSELAKAVNSGMDAHSFLGGQLLNEPYDTFLAKLKAGDKETKEIRQAAKAAIFGFSGMMSAATFVIAKRKEKSSVCTWFHHDDLCGEHMTTQWGKRDLKGSYCVRCIEDAQKLRNFYCKAFPEVPQFWKIVLDGLLVSDTITQFRSGRVRGGLEGPAAANSYFQGLASDGMKRALELMTREMYLVPDSPLYGSRLVVALHDETLLDIPDNGPDFVDAAARRQVELMVKAMREFTPDVQVRCEPALMRRWAKDAATVKDAQGRFIPYEDGNVPK